MVQRYFSFNLLFFFGERMCGLPTPMNFRGNLNFLTSNVTIDSAEEEQIVDPNTI